MVLLTLCAGQFLMMLDSSVMNVSMATVAKDVGTTITGIQTAITLYTLVMAAFMVTGGKIGQIARPQARLRDRLRDLRLPARASPRSRRTSGCCCVGWSCLEGVGAALILPAIVALVALNFGAGRTAAGLRAGCLRGGDRDRRRSDRRRPLHDLPLVALRVRGRGR